MSPYWGNPNKYFGLNTTATKKPSSGKGGLEIAYAKIEAREDENWGEKKEQAVADLKTIPTGKSVEQFLNVVGTPCFDLQFYSAQLHGEVSP